MVQPRLEYCLQFWAAKYKKDAKILKSIQKRASKLVKGLQDLSYEEKLRTFKFFRLEKRKLRGDLTDLYNFLRRGSRGGGPDLFFMVSDGRISGNSAKLHQGRFRLDIRKNLEVSNTETGFLERLLCPMPVQRSRGIQTMPSLICFDCWLALK